ncbi:MAG TPA: hypothetical protein PLH84_08570 [Candidatus Krumholzibacteria bacterium]|nr:hypothetical protein [Candidatus Krumholzibacteria bacterium]
MVSTTTLTSLAMLKVNVDQGKDYLDYLVPFVLQILIDQAMDPVTDTGVRDHLRTQFGLEIPERAIQIVLKRIARRRLLKRDTGVYRVAGKLPNPGITARKSEAERHIHAVLFGLIEFSKATVLPLATDDEAAAVVCEFLAEFDILCLRAYLRGTTIPTIGRGHRSHIVLVSEYVMHLQRTDPERFESFQVMVQGHMLANALLCPDLHSAPKTYRGVTFYLDTPLLVQRLGLEGEPKRAATESLIDLLKKLGGKVAAFSHSREELERVLRGAADHVDAHDGRGAIVMEARRVGATRSDLLVTAGQIDVRLTESGIELEETPRYIDALQIDEKVFEKALDDEVSYFNPRARIDDVNSVRSIYVLRKRTAPTTIEKCKAVLVTSNAAFSRAAYEYGKRHEETREVSSVITDFSLANMAWLKAPMGAPSLPTIEVMAFSYAALQPPKELLDKYLTEIDKLAKNGKLSERDHQLLRSSTVAHEELMHLTLGDEAGFTEETVTETLHRVSEEIKKEESQRLTAEEEAHRATQRQLAEEREKTERVQKMLYWKCRRRAKRCAWIMSGAVGALLLLGTAAGIGIRSDNAVVGWLLTSGSGLLIVLSSGNLAFGTTVKKLHEAASNRCLTRCIKREAEATGLELSGSD